MNIKAISREVAKYRRGRVPRTLRRQQLLAQAHDLFVEQGYERASMDELARRAGVSKPMIYDLCGSKEQLFRDVMTAVSAELEECVRAAVTAEAELGDKLRAGVLAFLHFVRQRRPAWTSLLAADAGPVGSEGVLLQRRQAELVAGLIVEGSHQSGLQPNPLTAQVLAQAVNGAVEFVALWWERHPEVSAEALAELVTRVFSPQLLELSALDVSVAGQSA